MLTELVWQLSCSANMARKSVTPSKGTSQTARKSTPLSNHGKGQIVQMKRKASAQLQKRVGLSNAGIGRLARRAGKEPATLGGRLVWILPEALAQNVHMGGGFWRLTRANRKPQA